ncbi:MAG: esterase-like activity of phytase family protein, partial [Propionibacteriales bacterium]|nr:esterase-like activity of phytase family protein [Propionibacteriales bacterium]
GALSADPRAPGQLWTATDAAFADTRILKINANRTPAMITSELPVTKDGQQASYDVEGLWAARDGFWLGVEGASGPDNLIVRTDLRGRVTDEILLPTEVSAELGKQGIEGITGSADGRTLTVALQRTAKGDPANTARIGRLDRQTGSWTWFLYPLSTTDVTGDWIGLSEIVTIDEDTVAVIERDKLSGPAAKIKRIMAVDLPSAAPGSVTRVDKKLLRDVVPDLRRTNGWTTEKLEGLTVDARGNWFAITDNDALKDNNGDTQFLRLGRLV